VDAVADAGVLDERRGDERRGVWLARHECHIRGRCLGYWTTATAAVGMLNSVVPLKRSLLVGAAVGVAVAAVAYACPHEVAAVVSGIAGACTAVAAQVGWWLRLAARRFGVL
jgi:hypothetical protein